MTAAASADVRTGMTSKSIRSCQFAIHCEGRLVLGFHDLETPFEREIDPTGPVSHRGRSHPTAVTKTPVDLGRLARLKVLDDHEQHAAPLSDDQIVIVTREAGARAASHCGVRMRHLLLCIVSFSLITGCNREKTPEGDDRAGRESESVRNPLDRSPVASRAGARRGSLFTQDAATRPATVAVPQERKLMRQGEATLEVASVGATLARLHALTREAGGYTTRETRSRDIQRVNQGQVDCRIPAGKLDSLTAALKSLGTLESLSLSATDVTEVLRPRSTTAQRARAQTRLLALIERPTNKLSDPLEVERELARVRGEIDQMEGRRRFWDNRVAFRPCQ